MKKSRAALQIVLIVALSVSMLLAGQEYFFWKARSSIEILVRKNQRFHDVQMTAEGMGIILQGEVKSKAGLRALYLKSTGSSGSGLIVL